MTNVGDMIVGGASGTPTRLGGGGTDNVLMMSGGVPVWRDPPTWQTISSGLLTAGATGFVRAATAPSFGTVNYNQARSYSFNGTTYLEWDFKQTTAGSAGAGSLYLLDLPTIGLPSLGLYYKPNTGSAFTDYTTPLGTFAITVGGASTGWGYVMPYSTTQLKLCVMNMTPTTASAGTWSPSFVGFNSAVLMISVKIQYT